MTTEAKKQQRPMADLLKEINEEKVPEYLKRFPQITYLEVVAPGKRNNKRFMAKMIFKGETRAGFKLKHFGSTTAVTYLDFPNPDKRLKFQRRFRAIYTDLNLGKKDADGNKLPRKAVRSIDVPGSASSLAYYLLW